MITAERLHELIKQGATIYPDYGPAISLNAVKSPKVVEDIAGYELQFLSKNTSASVYINDLYETEKERDICVAQKEWVVKTRAERTERFEPPMWEDLPIKWDFYFVKDKYMFHFGYENYNGDKRVIVSKCEYACEYGSDGYYVIYEKFGNATKENYIKACEIVRDLFNKGGAK